jgi:hypothetical protein
VRKKLHPHLTPELRSRAQVHVPPVAPEPVGIYPSLEDFYFYFYLTKMKASLEDFFILFYLTKMKASLEDSLRIRGLAYGH